jgi:hypothetical protein
MHLAPLRVTQGNARYALKYRVLAQPDGSERWQGRDDCD